MKKGGISAVILAGGSGQRMGGGFKQYMTLDNRPMLCFSIEAFQQAPSVDEIVLVTPAGHVDYCRENIVAPGGYGKVKKIIEGGAARQESSHLGVLATDSANAFVMVHDGARPFIQWQEIEAMAESLKTHRAAILAAPVKDTIKESDSHGFIRRTVDREFLLAAQTPQAFDRALILNAHDHAAKTDFTATDDASLVENMGEKVFLLKGSYFNIKITTKEDLVFAEAILAARRAPH